MNTYYDPEQRAFTFADTGYPVDTATRDTISATLTGGGDVWAEDGVIKTSGAAPAPGMRFDRKSGEWRTDPEAQAARLNEAKTYTLLQAAESAQAFIERVAGLDAVPPFERDSWATQALEAQAWAKDNNAPTPILAGIAKARGVPLDILRQKALAKSQAFVALTASIAGQRQAFEDAIRAADSIEALEAITIAYQMPVMPLSPAAGTS